MEYSKEFKIALSAFSSTDKDKLIFRLLKKHTIYLVAKIEINII